MVNKPILIFSGYNDRAVIAFCRYATSMKLTYFIATKGPSDYIYHSNFADNIIYERGRNDLSLSEILFISEKVKSLSDSKKLLILPSTEFLNRKLLEFRDILNHNLIEIGLCDGHIYNQVSDKYSFGELCEKFGIRKPTQLEEETLCFPLVIKPKQYFSSHNEIFKPSIISSQKEFDLFFADKMSSDFYIQKFIGGQSFYLLYYFFKDGSFSIYSQENLIQQANGGSIILAKSIVFPDANLVNEFAELFKSIQFSGLVMVEVKLFKGNFYMIEANPRLWGPSQLIIDAQMNLFDCFAIDNQLTDAVQKGIYKTNTWYFWSGSIDTNDRDNVHVDYHDYSCSSFMGDLEEIKKCDVYNRPDTKEIYSEIEG